MDLQLSDVMLSEFFSPIWLSLKVALMASVIAIITGTILAKWLARKQFKGKVLVETLLILPMVLPPTVVGFLLLVVFGRNSIVGRMIEWLFGQPVIFTIWAAIIASTVVAFPLMYNAAKAGFLTVDHSVEEAARVEGANEWQIFYRISVPLAANGLIAGALLCFARALGEFGATLMFAGNIPQKTQTLPTAIYVAINANNMSLAWLWVLAMIAISILVLFIIQIQARKAV